MKCCELAKCDLSKPQLYFASKCMAQARMGFQIKTRIVICLANMRGKFRGRMEYEACLAWRMEKDGKVMVTQSYLQVCPAYSRLRVGRNMEGSYTDLIN